MEQDKTPVAVPEDAGDSAEMEALAKDVGEDDAADADEGDGGAEKQVAETEEKDSSERKVPHGALHEERRKRQALAAEVQKLKDADARREDAFQKLLAKAQTADAPKAPDFDTDPAGWLKHQLETTGKTVQQLQQEREAETKQRQNQAQEQQFIARVQADEAEFTKEQPDYPDAAVWLRDKRIRMFELAGMSPQEAAQAVYGESIYYAQNAMRSGRNPGEVFYGLAREMGYSGPKAKTNDADAKIEKLVKGQEKSSRMSSGGESAENITLAQLAELEGEEFDKEWNRLRKKGLLG